MKLTGRQRDFLSKVLDIYREAHQPLHYSTIAKRLGISPITAYDMLRLLEERGLVASEYALPKKGARGRSSIVFYPTEKAAEVIAQLAGEVWEREEWETVKERILQALREGKGTDYQDLLEELLLRIPERRSPMLFLTEMITAAILVLYQLKEEVKAHAVFENLRTLGLPGEFALTALSGLVIGLTFMERAHQRFRTLLLSYARRYQEYLAQLTVENKRLLSDFVQEVLRIITT